MKTRSEAVIAAMPHVDFNKRYHIEDWAWRLDRAEDNGCDCEELRVREEALEVMLRFAGALKAYVEARKAK